MTKQQLNRKAYSRRYRSQLDMLQNEGLRHLNSDKRHDQTHSRCKMAPRSPESLLIIALLALSDARSAAGLCSVTSLAEFSSQIDTMLAAYDRDSPPRAAPGGAVPVALALHVRHASILTEPDTAMRLLADLQMKWKDARLSWNASAWGCDAALVSPERLWVPDVQLVSAAYGGPGAGEPARARLSSDGAVRWAARLDVTAPLALQLDAWPNDEQTASFTFASNSAVNLTIDEPESSAGKWQSSDWEYRVTALGRDAGAAGATEAAGAAGTVVWAVSVRRQGAAHALATGAVLATAVLLLVAAALLPPTARPPLCATASFICSLWLITALVRLPGAPSSPLSLRLMCAVCACGGAAAALAGAVHALARCARPAPPRLRHALAALAARVKLAPHEDVVGAECVSGAWAQAARLLDLALLAALLGALFVIVCIYL